MSLCGTNDISVTDRTSQSLLDVLQCKKLRQKVEKTDCSILRSQSITVVTYFYRQIPKTFLIEFFSSFQYDSLQPPFNYFAILSFFEIKNK